MVTATLLTINRRRRVKGNARRCLGDVIGELILVSVVIVLAFVIVAYIRSVWHVQANQVVLTPILSVRGDTGASASGGGLVLELHIRNEGHRDAVILKVEVRSDRGSWVNTSRLVVPPGSSFDYTISSWEWVGPDGPPTPSRGEKYRVIIYTEDSGVLIYDVVLS